MTNRLLQEQLAIKYKNLHLSKAKLKQTSHTSALLSGFAMVALVEVQLSNDGHVPEWLLISFAIVTSLLVSVHLIAVMISTCILPHIEAIAHLDLKSLDDSPHERLKNYIQLAWACSTTIGLILFLVDIAIIVWVKFYDFSWWASAGTTLLLLPILVIFIAFAWHFYWALGEHSYSVTSRKLLALEDYMRELQEGGGGGVVLMHQQQQQMPANSSSDFTNPGPADSQLVAVSEHPSSSRSQSSRHIQITKQNSKVSNASMPSVSMGGSMAVTKDIEATYVLQRVFNSGRNNNFAGLFQPVVAPDGVALYAGDMRRSINDGGEQGNAYITVSGGNVSLHHRPSFDTIDEKGPQPSAVASRTSTPAQANDASVKNVANATNNVASWPEVNKQRQHVQHHPQVLSTNSWQAMNERWQRGNTLA